MRVALLNNSPAVSRLVTLSLDKMGYEYVEFQSADELEAGFDILVLDSDVNVDGINLKDYVDKILFLSSKDLTFLNEADKTLQKPFLPTEFVSIMEILSNSSVKNDTKDEEDEVKFDDAQSFVDGTQDDVVVDFTESESAFDEIRLDDLDDIKIDDFDSGENLEPKSDTIDELSELMHEIDEMPSQDKENSDSDLSQELSQDVKTDKIEQTDDIENIDELLKEIDEPVEELVLDESKNDEALDVNFSQEPENQINDEIVTEAIEEEQNSFKEDENIENLEEIESNSDESQCESENFDEKIENSDDLDEQIQLDEVAENLDDIDDTIKDEVSDTAGENEEILQDEFVDDIDSLSERELKLALDESVDELENCEVADLTQEVEEEITQSEENNTFEIDTLKADLSDKISEQITSALNSSELRAVLKDLNIKINISFEDK